MDREQPSRLKTESPAQTSPLLRAINTTMIALENRAGLFRNLIVAVIATSAASLILTLIVHRWMALSGFILILPLVGGYLVRDSRRVRHWRSEVLQQWRSDPNDYTLFKKAMLGLPNLPARSLKTMLATLPEIITSEEEKGQHNFESRCRRDERKILFATLLLTLALLTVAGAAAYHSVSLLGSAALLITVMAGLKMK